MPCSNKEYLDRVKKLGIRLNDHKTVCRAVCLEIQEREKEIAELSNYVTSCSGRLQEEIDSITPSGSVTSGDVQALITTASGDLQQQITAETATRLREIGNINSTLNTLVTHKGLNETEVITLISGAFEILQDEIKYLSDQINGSGT